MSIGHIRPFAPTGFCFAPDQFYCMVEARLRISGEYVRHIPKDDGQTPQWVVMNYQYVPQELRLSGEYKLSGTNPVLFGLANHFETPPTNHRESNAGKRESGSCFEVRGVLYGVKCVEITHTECLKVQLCRLEKCAEPRPGFFEEVEELLCDEKENCVAT